MDLKEAIKKIEDTKGMSIEDIFLNEAAKKVVKAMENGNQEDVIENSRFIFSLIHRRIQKEEDERQNEREIKRLEKFKTEGWHFPSKNDFPEEDYQVLCYSTSNGYVVCSYYKEGIWIPSFRESLVSIGNENITAWQYIENPEDDRRQAPNSVKSLRRFNYENDKGY